MHTNKLIVSLISFFLAFFLVLTLNQTAEVQEVSPETEEEKTEEPKPEEPKLAAYLSYRGSLEHWDENGMRITALTGNVELYLADRVIMADRVIGWSELKETEDKKEKFPFDGIYAEGNVKVISGKDKIFADQVYYDFKSGTGIITNVEIRTVYTDEDGHIPLAAVPIVIRAKEVLQVNPTTLLAKAASVTTCPHGKPHYHFQVKTVRLIHDEKGKRIILKHIVPKIMGIPVFYWPYYKKTLGTDPFLRSVKIEDSSRFGTTIRTEYGLNINRYKRNEKGELLKDKDGYYISKRWGDFTIRNDHFQKRGLGWAPEFVYDWSNYKGFIKGYRIKDDGPDPDIKYEQQFLPLKKHERSRVKMFHRYFLRTDLRLDTELSWLSDRNFLQEFFEKEYKEGKEQESYGYLRYAMNNKAITLLDRFRINNFHPTYTEYLPRVTAKLITQPLDILNLNKPIYFSSFSEVTNTNIRYDDALHQPSLRIWRFDSLNELSYPFAGKYINFSPFLSFRFTEYEKGIYKNDSIDRFVGSGGIKLYSKFQRIFDAHNKTLGINQLCHIISFDARYTNNYEVDTQPAKLIQHDSIDEINDFEECYLEIRNRFKTRSGDKFFEFLNLGLAVEYYPDSDRDTISENHNNYFYPMNWITLAPDDKNQHPRRNFSNINFDLGFTPKNSFSLTLDSEYNTYNKNMETMNIGLGFNPYPGWNVLLNERYIKHRSNAVGMTLSCIPIEKWQLSASDQYDFKQDRFTNRAYTLRRDLHEFFLEFSIWVDEGKDERTFHITITPKGIFEKPTKIKDY